MGRIGITFNYWGNDWMEDLEEYERRIARAAAIGFDLMSFSQDVLFLYTPEHPGLLPPRERREAEEGPRLLHRHAAQRGAA